MSGRTLRAGHISIRWVSGLVMALLLAAVLVAATSIRAFGIDAGDLAEQPQLLVGALAVACLLAAWAGQAAVSGGWRRAVGVGAGLGVIWGPVTVGVMVVATTVDAVVRGSADPLTGVGSAVVWVLYGIAVICLFSAAIAAPIGVAWAVFSRALARAIGARPGRASRVGRGATVMLVLMGVLAGVGEALAVQPLQARCLDLTGHPTHASFSPDGHLLAAITQTDPNEPGAVILLDWPSAREVGRWSAWVDQSVAVADDGRIYWSAWVLGPAPVALDGSGDGIYTVRGSEAPHLIGSGSESTLHDLAWTVDGLRGTTPNSHRLAALRFGQDTIEVLPGQPAEDVGAFWASADGGTSAWSEGWFGTSVTVASPTGRRDVLVGGDDQRSIAMTADGRTLVAAAWGGGTRVVDLATGERRLILQGRQQFIALSAGGDLAWAADDQIGHGRLCAVALSSLTG